MPDPQINSRLDNLPAPLSTFIGREREIAEVKERLSAHRLLETIRQYAHEKLAESGKAEATRGRHLDYFVQWAEDAEPHLTGPAQLAWLSRFEVEHDNLRAALEWSQTAENRAIPGLRLAGACGRFWRLRGYLSEGRMRLSTALAQAESRKPQNAAARAWALDRAANLAYLQSDYPATRSLSEESLAIWRELGETGRQGVAEALSMLGEVATEEGDYATAPALFEEALAIWRALKDARGIGNELMQLGWAAMRTGDYEQAAARLEEALTWSRKAEYTTDIAFTLAGLGEVAVRQGQYERATRLLEESLAIRREHGDKWGTGTSLGALGWVALRQRDFVRMRALLRESLVVRILLGDKGGIAWCLEKLAEAATVQGQAVPSSARSEHFRRAVRVFGAAAALRTPVNSVIDPADRPAYERNLAILRAALREETFAATWTEGSKMALEEVVEYALSEPDLPAMPKKGSFGGLSAREREAAVLIAQGKSNREIAEEMTVRVKTVETYITRILNKLSFDSRVQIAIWAKDKGLA